MGTQSLDVGRAARVGGSRHLGAPLLVSLGEVPLRIANPSFPERSRPVRIRSAMRELRGKLSDLEEIGAAALPSTHSTVRTRRAREPPRLPPCSC